LLFKLNLIPFSQFKCFVGLHAQASRNYLRHVAEEKEEKREIKIKTTLIVYPRVHIPRGKNSADVATG
jgi:hypothetical protein